MDKSWLVWVQTSPNFWFLRIRVSYVWKITNLWKSCWWFWLLRLFPQWTLSDSFWLKTWKLQTNLQLIILIELHELTIWCHFTGSVHRPCLLQLHQLFRPWSDNHAKLKLVYCLLIQQLYPPAEKFAHFTTNKRSFSGFFEIIPKLPHELSKKKKVHSLTNISNQRGSVQLWSNFPKCNFV